MNRHFAEFMVYKGNFQAAVIMDLLRMVINEQKKRGYLPKQPTIEPITKSRGPVLEAAVRMEDLLHRNEQIAQRREKAIRSLVALELRIDVLLDEVQRIKKKYKVD